MGHLFSNCYQSLGGASCGAANSGTLRMYRPSTLFLPENALQPREVGACRKMPSADMGAVSAEEVRVGLPEYLP